MMELAFGLACSVSLETEVICCYPNKHTILATLIVFEDAIQAADPRQCFHLVFVHMVGRVFLATGFPAPEPAPASTWLGVAPGKSRLYFCVDVLVRTE